VRYPQLTAVDGAELLCQLQQLLGDPARHVDEDQVGEHGVGTPQPAGDDTQQLHGDLRALLGPLLQGVLGQPGQPSVRDDHGGRGTRARVEQ
jgi:hypothetical protein